MRKAVGYALVALPFVVLLVLAVMEMGWAGALGGLVVLGLLLACILRGMKLIVEE